MALVSLDVNAINAERVHYWRLLSRDFYRGPTVIVARQARFASSEAGMSTRATLGRALLIPVAWVAYTLVRGTFTHQYPYGFVNVWRIGYAQVAINIVVILIGALLFMALFAGADWLIRKVSQQK